MTDLLALARECGGDAYGTNDDCTVMNATSLTAFAERIRSDERERCAAIAESDEFYGSAVPVAIADAIRKKP